MLTVPMHITHAQTRRSREPVQALQPLADPTRGWLTPAEPDPLSWR